MPTPELAVSDNTIFTKNERDYKSARQKLLETVLDAPKSGYAAVTKQQLHSLVESLAVRLHLFAGEYPVFLPHAVKAIMEHPQLSRTDRATLDAFCKMFELDWRGDHSLANRE